MCLTDRKSTRLNSSHRCISYAVFCLKKKKKKHKQKPPTQNTSHNRRSVQTASCHAPMCYAHRPSRHILLCDPLSSLFFFFFFNVRGPPEFSPFPLHAAFPI